MDVSIRLHAWSGTWTSGQRDQLLVLEGLISIPAFPHLCPGSEDPTLHLVAASSTLEGGHSSPHSPAGFTPSVGGTVRKALSTLLCFAVFTVRFALSLRTLFIQSLGARVVCVSQQVGLGLLPCFAGTPGITHRAPPSLFSVPGSPEEVRGKF